MFKPNRSMMLAALVFTPPAIVVAAQPLAAQTLQEALAMAYANNPTLQAARAQLRSVDENVPQALGNWRPTVQLQGSAGQTATGGSSNDQRIRERSRDPVSLSASVTQPLYRGGRTGASVRQAENQVLAQRAQLLATEQQVLLDTVNAYVSVIQNQEEVRLNINNEQVLMRQLQATNERFRVGEITRTDVAQAESRLAGARSSRADAEGRLQTARATFQRFVGQPPQRLSAPQPLRPPVTSAQEAAQLAAQNNPNVVSALFTEAAQRDRIDVQYGSLLPQAGITAQLFRQDNQGGTGVGADTRTQGTSVTANLTVPIYQGGSEYAAVRQARQDAQRARQQIDEQRRRFSAEATQGWERLTASRAQVESRRAQIRAAEIALDGVQREAIVGSRTTLDVLNAEQELLNARVDLVRALATLVNESHNLVAAVGRLTARDLALPVPLYDMEAYYREVRNRWIGLGDYSEAGRR